MLESEDEARRQIARGTGRLNVGSHSVPDDVFVALDEGTVEKYLDVFRKVFSKLGHASHYNMMIGGPFVIETTTVA
jgi:wobble nucleotide-excising tRNase